MSDLITTSETIVTNTGPIDLSVLGNRKYIAEMILTDIDNYCATTYDDGHRKHLGASIIGHDCSRYLFNTFRWMKKETFTGRMQRLFNRGHREEARFIEWLRGIGFKVWDLEADTGKQIRIKACMGHFGGSLDGVNQAPEKYRIPEPMLCEFKTNGTGSGFEKLKKDKVKKAKPRHYIQMCMYGKEYKLKYALYMCINKNDDDLHIEIVELDWQLAETYERKAQDVISSTIPPEKIAFSEAHFDCKYCGFVGICHRDELPEVNCRSCYKSTPVDDGKWFCKEYGAIIPEEVIPKACERYEAIK